jgi:hypothetical protein
MTIATAVQNPRVRDDAAGADAAGAEEVITTAKHTSFDA